MSSTSTYTYYEEVLWFMVHTVVKMASLSWRMFVTRRPKNVFLAVLTTSCSLLLLGLVRIPNISQSTDDKGSLWERGVMEEHALSRRLLEPAATSPPGILMQTTPRTIRRRSRQAANLSMSLCPFSPEELNLRGEIPVNYTVPTWADLEARNVDLDPGGHWEPSDCIPRHNVAIVVPYRDREKQLLLFLQHLHPFLKKQKLSYTIYVLEQIPGKVFNRGLDRNIGYIESLKLNPHHECTMFHDVDLLPLDERNVYSCPDQPRHVCVAVNYINNFMPLYKDSFAEFGHVTFFRNDQFKMINGYSNLYLGWGAEDDDIHKRLQSKGMHVYRYPDHIAKYYGIPHPDESKLPRPVSIAQNVSRFKLLNLAERRMFSDGLSSSNYSVIAISREKLFTRIKFDVEEDEYAFQALAEQTLYTELYANLTEYWRKLDFIPPPYWWKNNTLSTAVRRQPAQQIAERLATKRARTQIKRKKVRKKVVRVQRVKEKGPNDCAPCF